jgi:hypothetical protein
MAWVAISAATETASKRRIGLPPPILAYRLADETGDDEADTLRPQNTRYSRMITTRGTPISHIKIPAMIEISLCEWF